MKSIVLIGPYGIGKTTIGQLLASDLGKAIFSLDEYAWKYYKEKGLSLEAAESLGDLDSLQWQPYYAHAVRRFIEDHKDEMCIIDLGVGHSLYEDTYLEEMRNVFMPYNVILLTPSPDIDIAMKELNERNDANICKRTHSHTRLNLSFLKNPSIYQLAKHVIYTKGKTPTEILREILKIDLE
ncbi:AAA family ATPase [Candidatus Viridilinea mediisalina]|uniref:AAA family ATPase n=1 Tax=Candidatus Viridilinea mediisalina TaxID=2024553 RepID=UPI0013FD4AF6|nr:shikimate kinase [Candidatus Viridilinea mediisalina]